MRVTVGIPTFNRSGLLREAMQSVLAQTYPSFRLIVSDNASDDDTPEVVRSFSDERIRYVRSEHNIGPAGNFRRVMELAETEFLVILPDDDVLYSDHLRAAVEILDRFENVGLAHTAFDVIDERSRVTGSVSPLASDSPVRIETRDHALERLMVSDWPICFSSVLYRTKAIVDAGGIRAEEEPFGDIQLWMRIALNWDFGYVAKPLAGFRVHQATTTNGIGVEHGVDSGGRELALLHEQIRFQRRTDFLEKAPLEPRTTKRLRALATLHLLAERASSEPVADLANLVRTHPRIVLRPALWRLVVARLGGRRARSALRKASIRGDRRRDRAE
jgi:glycosyltransferase involved in cell wall biosynthesis